MRDYSLIEVDDEYNKIQKLNQKDAILILLNVFSGLQGLLLLETNKKLKSIQQEYENKINDLIQAANNNSENKKKVLNFNHIKKVLDWTGSYMASGEIKYYDGYTARDCRIEELLIHFISRFSNIFKYTLAGSGHNSLLQSNNIRQYSWELRFTHEKNLNVTLQINYSKERVIIKKVEFPELYRDNYYDVTFEKPAGFNYPVYFNNGDYRTLEFAITNQEISLRNQGW